MATDQVPATIVLGRVTRPHGIRGEVVIRGDADALGLMPEIEPLLLMRDDDGLRPAGIVGLRTVRGGLVARLAGVDDRTAAEAVVGATMEVEAGTLPAPTRERYLWEQIEGFEVVTTGGESLGRLEDRIVTGAHDVFVVRDDVREVLVPASPNVLIDMDASAGRLVIEAIPGLLDLNDD